MTQINQQLMDSCLSNLKALAIAFLLSITLPIDTFAQTTTVAPVAGWRVGSSSSLGIRSSPEGMPAETCEIAGIYGVKEVRLGTASNTTINFTCLIWNRFQTTSYGVDSAAEWYTRCPSGFSEMDVSYDGAKKTIGYCQASAATVLPNNTPQECSPSAGQPIYIDNRRKVQKELDYRGSGDFPLEYYRVYRSNVPGNYANYHLENSDYKAWTSNLTRRIEGSEVTTGANGVLIYLPDPATGWYKPQPFNLAAILGSSVHHAYRSDGTYIQFNDYQSDSGVRYQLQQITLSDGSDGYQLITPSNETEIYNSVGRLIEHRAIGGRHHIYNYSMDGLLDSIADQYGRKLQFEYDEDSRISALIQPDGSRIEYSYNANGDYASVEYPSTGGGTAVKQYHYENTQYFRALTGITNEEGVRYATWTYDANGYAVESVLAGGVDRTLFDGSQYGGPVTVTNPLGKETVYSFSTINGRNQLTSVDGIATENCAASSSNRTYDSNGYVASMTDWNGNLTTYVRDNRGLALTTTVAVGTTEERTTTRVWHPTLILPTQEIFPESTIDYSYDALGNVLTRTVTDNDTGESRTWAYAYDTAGKLLSEDGPRDDVVDVTTYTYHNCTTGGACGELQSITNALGHVTTLSEYNVHGQPTTIIDPNGVISTRTYNARQWLTSQTTDSQTITLSYDQVGNVTRVTLSDGTYTNYTWDGANRLIALSDAQGNLIEWTLDAAGNRTQERIKNSSGTLTKLQNQVYDELSRLRKLIPSHGGETEFGYDKNSNQTRKTDPSQRTTDQSFDGLDRLISLQDAIQGVTSFTYDDQDNLTSVVDPKGVTTTYTYNGFGDRLSEVSPEAGTSTFTYDSAGNLVGKLDARGISSAYTYDAVNRLTSIVYPNGSENVSYTYDQGVNGVGRLSGISDESGSQAYSYDARGNIISVTYQIGTQQYTTAYTYNGANRLTSFTLPSGRVVSYAYDGSGRVDTINSTADGDTESIASNISRLPFGPSTGMVLGNGLQRSRSFDQDYRVTNIADGSILQRNYAWNSVNNITAITDSVDSAASQFFTYDDLDRLTFATGDYGEQSFSYDGVGNRLALTEDTTTKNYQYGADNHRLLQIAGERSFSYDAAGNTLDNGNASFTYNNRNRMDSATAAGMTTDYTYNALGQRVSKSNANESIHYIYDLSGLLIAEASAEGEVEVEYTYLDGEPLAMWRDDEPEPTAPGVVFPTGPLGTIDTATPDFVWNDEGNSDEYQIIVYDRFLSERVLNQRYSTSAVCSAGVCTVAPAVTVNFSANHYWRVRGLNAQGWGEWSAVTRFNYLDAVPDAVIPIAPISSIDTATPTYQWQDLGNALEYQVLIYDRVLRTQIYNERLLATDACTSGTCSVLPEGINVNFSTNHFWRIRARNSGGWNTWSDPIRFDYLDAPPATPAAISPTGDIDTTNPTFEWSSVPNALEYQVIIHDRVLNTRLYNERHLEDDVCSEASCEVTPADVTISEGNNHYWRVRSRNTGGWSAWSVVNRFDVQTGGQ